MHYLSITKYRVSQKKVIKKIELKKCAYEVCQNKRQGEDQKWGKSAKIWGNFKLQYIKLETRF